MNEDELGDAVDDNDEDTVGDGQSVTGYGSKAMECPRPPSVRPRSDNIRSFVAIFRRVNLDTHLPHLDLGRSLPGEAGEELDQAVGELQVVVVQRSEQTLSSITIIFGHEMCKEYKCL